MHAIMWENILTVHITVSIRRDVNFNFAAQLDVDFLSFVTHNNTFNYNLGASIDDFIHSMEHQNIALEVDISGTRNGLDDPSYNGAIIVSGHEKVCWSLFSNFFLKVSIANMPSIYLGFQFRKQNEKYILLSFINYWIIVISMIYNSYINHYLLTHTVCISKIKILYNPHTIQVHI